MGSTWILTAKVLFSRFFVWCKKNWKFIAGIAVSSAIMMLTRKRIDFGKIIKNTNNSYRQEIDVINKSHEKEVESVSIELKRYNQVLEQIEIEYAKKEKDLSASGKKEIKKLIKENKDNPEEITKRLATLMGFTVHVD